MDLVIVCHRHPPGGGEVTPYDGLYGEALPERVTFFSLQVYEMLGISLVEVYECVGKYVISSVKRLKRANRCILRQWKSWEKVLVLWFIHILKTVNLKLLKGMLSSKLGMWKGYHLPMEGIRNGEFFCHKRYIKGSGVKPGGRASPYNTFLVPPGTLWTPDEAYRTRVCVAS